MVKIQVSGKLRRVNWHIFAKETLVLVSKLLCGVCSYESRLTAMYSVLKIDGLQFFSFLTSPLVTSERSASR